MTSLQMQTFSWQRMSLMQLCMPCRDACSITFGCKLMSHRTVCSSWYPNFIGHTPSSSDVQIAEFQDFLDIQARILGRQHGNSGSFLQPWNQKHKAVRELLWKVFARPAAQAQPNGWLEIKPMPWPWASQVLETKPGKICGFKKGHAQGQRQAGGTAFRNSRISIAFKELPWSLRVKRICTNLIQAKHQYSLE